MKEEIYNLIKESESIAIFAHKSPDGDAIGSVIAFYEMLVNINKQVVMIMDEIPPVFNYLKNIEKIQSTSNGEYDLAIVLDCANYERIGQIDNVFARCKKSIAIDHHFTNTKYCDVNYVVADSPACCQIVYSLFKEWNVEITNDMGEALITGLLTDTNGYRNDNVNETTFLMSADLIKNGVEIHRIYRDVLCKKTRSQQALIKMASERLEFFDDGKIAFSYISVEDMANVGAKLGDHEGLVDIGRDVDGVEVSVFLREDGGYKASFRSNGLVDVSKIAAKFGGGGHVMASGAKINMSFKETKDAIIEEITRTLEE